MHGPIKRVDIELSHPLVSIEQLKGYVEVHILVRLHGTPIGVVPMPVIADRCEAAELSTAITQRLTWPILRAVLCERLAAGPQPERIELASVCAPLPAPPTAPTPLVTVAVCTRDRTDDLASCLDALSQIDYPALDLLVVDNAPRTDATAQLVARYPHVRYVRENRPGLDWARNRAIAEAHGEIIAYTDDDVVVDAGWVRALVQVFNDNPRVMAVTGLVVPYELETEAQWLFEEYGGFGRGFVRRWAAIDTTSRARWRSFGTGQYGTGANMAYRRSVFAHIGDFDPALDVGTVTNGGGDLEMMFRVLEHGYVLVYEPSAMVRHRHRRTYAQLHRQISANGNGLYAYFVQAMLAYPHERLLFLWLAAWWIGWWHVRRLVKSLVVPSRFPRELILAELWNSLLGLRRYQRARRTAAQLARETGATLAPLPHTPPQARALPTRLRAAAIDALDLSQPLPTLLEPDNARRVRLLVTWGGRALGNVEIVSNRQPIGTLQIRDAVVEQLGIKLLNTPRFQSAATTWSMLHAMLAQQYAAPNVAAPPASPETISVVVATADRPDGLRACLRDILAQTVTHPVEVIVVDNNPASGLTPPVVAEFPQVRLISEPRKGASYARNAGFLASRGAIVATTDDDVTLPSDWLARLIEPFARSDVACVTGNVLAAELETPAQHVFEQYGGLSRGFERIEANWHWFTWYTHGAAPTWSLGATANAAFRATIFRDPRVGLMEEALGPGTSGGPSEDIYYFYRLLRAGYTIIYEPTAYVWHTHRRTMRALRHQVYTYGQAHVNYHLMTLLRDHDLRAVPQLLYWLPKTHLWRIKEWLRGRSDLPLSLILYEIAGNVGAPVGLWRAHRRVQQQGRSVVPARAASRTFASEQAAAETMLLDRGS